MERLHEMANFSNTSLSPEDDARSKKWFFDLHIICIFLICMCVIGLLGNGTVIHILAFHIKRSTFITYILNLAVADFGVLLFWILLCIIFLIKKPCTIPDDLVNIGATFMYIASQLLLTAVSIDRSVSVLFPIWYRCHRPERWPTVVCALMWLLASLLAGICPILENWKNRLNCRWSCLFYPFIGTAILCLPLVSVSAVVLLSKVFCKPQQPQRKRLLIIVLLTVLFFLTFAFPLSAINTINYFSEYKYDFLHPYGSLCACLNSCVNPIIYYAAGRKKKTQNRETVKVIIQRAFKEEQHREEKGTITQTYP